VEVRQTSKTIIGVQESIAIIVIGEIGQINNSNNSNN
jgi:hypothetical protein